MVALHTANPIIGDHSMPAVAVEIWNKLPLSSTSSELTPMMKIVVDIVGSRLNIFKSFCADDSQNGILTFYWTNFIQHHR